MSTAAGWYAVRQFASGKVLGSRPMTEAEAHTEVNTWRSEIGRAAVVLADPEARKAVRTEDQAELSKLLNDNEPHVWVSTTSHRSRERLRQVHRIAGDEFGPGPEYGAWSKGPGIAHGCYYLVNARHIEDVKAIKGVRVLQLAPKDLFKRWGQDKQEGGVSL